MLSMRTCLSSDQITQQMQQLILIEGVRSTDATASVLRSTGCSLAGSAPGGLVKRPAKNFDHACPCFREMLARAENLAPGMATGKRMRMQRITAMRKRWQRMSVLPLHSRPKPSPGEHPPTLHSLHAAKYSVAQHASLLQERAVYSGYELSGKSLRCLH